MKLEEIKELIKTIDESEINELEIKQEGFKIKLSKEKQVVSTVVQQPQELRETVSHAPSVKSQEIAVEENIESEDIDSLPDNMYVVKSPIVGTFYDSPSPDADKYVKVGDSVKSGEVLCIVEAMKIMNEIKTDVDGEIHEILVENEDIVEYDQPLMIVRR